MNEGHANGTIILNSEIKPEELKPTIPLVVRWLVYETDSLERDYGGKI